MATKKRRKFLAKIPCETRAERDAIEAFGNHPLLHRFVQIASDPRVDGKTQAAILNKMGDAIQEGLLDSLAESGAKETSGD